MLDQLAVLHDHHLVGDLADDGQIVGDEQVAQAAFGLQVVEQTQHLVLHQHVEGGDRLVAHDDVGVQRHGARDGDALALAAGQLVRVAAHGGLGQLDHVEQPAHTLLTALLVADLVDAQRLLDRAVDRVHRVERTVRVLEDRLHVAAEVEQCGALEGGDVLALVGHGAVGRLKQLQHHVRHGGLAGARLAHDGQRGAALDRERDVVHGLEHLLTARELELLGQVVHGDDVLALLKGLLALDVVLHQGGGVLAALLGGDDALRGQRRGRGHQTLGVRVLRVLQDIQRRAGFHDLALVHHHDVLGALGGQTQVVGDEQHGGAQRIGEHAQVVENLLLHGHVERGGRLVGDQQVRAGGQADGDQRALAHAAGELVWELTCAGGRVGQARLGQQAGDAVVHRGADDVLFGDAPGLVMVHTGLDQVLGHAPAGFGARHPFGAEVLHAALDVRVAGLLDGGLGGIHQGGQFLGAQEGLVVLALEVHVLGHQRLGQRGTLLMRDVHVVGGQRLLDLGADAPHRVEVAHRVLRDQAHAGAADLLILLAVELAQLLAAELDRTAGDLAGAGQQAEHGHGRGGLARAGLTHDGHPLARIDGEGCVTHRMHRMALVRREVDLQVLDLKQRAVRFLVLANGVDLRRANSVFVAHHASTHAVRLLGSRASFTASPIMMNASTVTASAADG